MFKIVLVVTLVLALAYVISFGVGTVIGIFMPA